MKQNWVKISAIFFLVLGILATTINSWNAEYFGLQNATVAALVERGTFTLVDQVIPGFNLVEGTETFRYGKNIYPMKQPGGTMLGALVYAPLYKVNFKYTNHFDYVSHFVTFFTSSLLVALSSILIYLIAKEMGVRPNIATLGSFLYPFATIVWPYAGVSHHDIYGSFWVLAAIYLFYRSQKDNRYNYLLFAGICSTLSLFFTMLPLTFTIVLWGILVARRKLRPILSYSMGAIIGFLPNMIFNGLVFGNPLLPPNLAGKVSDTIPLLSLTNLAQKLWFYLLSPTTSLFVFSPILIFGLIGIWTLRRSEPLLHKILFYVPIIHLLHISSMETFGGYQYGPRYLLPIIACLIIGVVKWIQDPRSKIANILFGVSLVWSVIVSLIGAIQTVMYPMPGPFAPTTLANQILMGKMPEFRMIPFGILLILLATLTFGINKIQASKRK